MPAIKIEWYHGQVIDDMKHENENRQNAIELLGSVIKKGIG